LILVILHLGSLTTIQNFKLAILSYQCPFTDGPIVYQARTLHSIITEEVQPYNDLGCEDRGYSKISNNSPEAAEASDIESVLIANEKTTQAKFKKTSIYDIYPNPAQEVFSIISNVKTEKLDIRITDVSGKLLMKKSIITNNYSYELPVDLLNGIYFVNLLNYNGEKIVKKLIISK